MGMWIMKMCDLWHYYPELIFTIKIYQVLCSTSLYMYNSQLIVGVSQNRDLPPFKQSGKQASLMGNFAAIWGSLILWVYPWGNDPIWDPNCVCTCMHVLIDVLYIYVITVYIFTVHSSTNWPITFNRMITHISDASAISPVWLRWIAPPSKWSNGASGNLSKWKTYMIQYRHQLAGFKHFSNFHPEPWGNDPIWLMFSRWVGSTTN